MPVEYPPESECYIELQNKERIAYSIHDDVVIFDGKTEIDGEVRLRWFDHPIRDYLRDSCFYVKQINFIVVIGDLVLANKIINSTVITFVVGNKPMYGPCSMGLAANFKNITLDPPVKIERNQHFGMNIDFGDIERGPSEISELLMGPKKKGRVLLLDDEVPDEPIVVEPPKRSYANLLEEFNDYDGLKIIRCVLGGVLERTVA